MREFGRALRVVALGLAVGLALGLGAAAQAQYPPVTGSVALAAGNAAPGLNEGVAITASVLDEEGAAQVGVACTFTIAAQPGSDASVEAGPFTTDASGSVSSSLRTGSAAGTIMVQVQCGELSAQVSVVAGASTGPQGGEPEAAPPASLPETGGGESDGANWLFWALLGAGIFAALSGLVVARRRVKA